MNTYSAEQVRLRRPLTPVCIASAALASVSALTMRQVHLGTNFPIEAPSPNTAAVRQINVASAPRNVVILCALRSGVAGVFQLRTTTSLVRENIKPAPPR